MDTLHPRLVGQIEEDLSYWPCITKEMINNSLSTGVHLHIKIIDNKLYVLKNNYSYETRNDSVLNVLADVVKYRKVPDCELVIDCQDARYVDLKGIYPAFAMAKSYDSKLILYPDFSFGSWPEVGILPWGKTIEIALQKAREIKWNDKIEKLFFRGANTNPIRVFMERLSLEYPDIIDCRLMTWHKGKGIRLEGSSTYVSIYDHGIYKYLINLPGNTYSSRLKYLFLFFSLVIHIDNGWIEFWYKLLENGKNCLILNVDQIIDIVDIVKYLQIKDREIIEIAKKGTDTIVKYLSYEKVLDYWQLLLIKYSKKLGYKVIL